MANLPESTTYDAGVTQLETTTPVQGGVDGASNTPLKNLANRTNYLKRHVDDLESGTTIPPTLAPKNSPTLTGDPKAPTPALGDNDTSISTTAFVQGTVGGILTKNVAGGVNVTLTAVEAGNGILIFTGAITANINVIVPNVSKYWVAANRTTGEFSLTIKTAAGTGVVLPKDLASIVCCDLTNVIPASASGEKSFTQYPFTPAAGTTSLAITNGYTPGNIIVEKNGALLEPAEYIATNGTTVQVNPTMAGDTFTVYVFASFKIADVVALSDLAASTGAGLIGGAAQVVSSIAALRALKKTSPSSKAFVTGYYADGDGGGGAYYYDSTDTTSADNGGSIIVADDGGRWKPSDTFSIRVERFGAKGDGSFDCTNAVLKAVAALRANAVDILDNIGGTTITAYSSGALEFGPGVFVVSADALQFTQDLGLTFRGTGSRRTNNAVRAATTLLISGTSSGFGIQFSGNGARGAAIQDMDICYADANFTGDMIDSLNCPGLILRRAFVGTFGLTGATRLQTARSLVRATYDEFHHFKDTVFDGAVDGWWSDDVRALNANDFGGSVTQFDNCLFYDFTGKPIRHDGNRTRVNVKLNNTSVNPISVNCVRGIDLTNVEGLTIDGGVCAGSVANHATTEWIRLSNVTGKVAALCLDDNSKAGTLDGMLELHGNRIYCTDGFTLTGGVITSRANEFSKGANGYVLSPTYDLCVDLGPELFKAAITTSYYVPADSTLLSGRINYNQAGDSSASKFSNASPRVKFRNVDGKQVSVPDAAFVPSKVDSGRTFIATGTSSQTFTLPQPSPGLKFTIRKASTVGMRVDASTTGQLYVGTGGVKTSVIAASTDVGGVAVFEAYGTTAWLVTLSGTWALS